MADAPFLNGDRGEARESGSRRRVLAAALVVLTAVSAAMIHAAAQAPREAKRNAPPEGERAGPRVLTPVESNVAVARVQARAYILRAAGDAVMVYVLNDPDEEEKTKGSAEGKRLQQVLSQNANPGKAPPARDVARAIAKAMPFSGMPGMPGAAGKDAALKPIPLKRLGEEESRPAEQVLPVRMAVIAASFPYKAQVEEFRAKLRLRSAVAVLEEQDADGLPTFRFLGVRVERRTLGADGKPLTPYAAVDVAAAYRPYLLLSGKRFEPEEPPALTQLIFPGLVMPKLLAFRPHQYPAVETELKTLRKSLEQAPRPARGVLPPAGPPAPAEQVDFLPGIAKPRPAPLPPAVAKPRKTPAPKAPPVPAPPAPGVFIPDYCLLRVIDVTVQPGKVYQYRLRVRMANPNYGRKDVAAPELARDRELCSE